MSLESNKRAVHRYCEELFTAGKLDVADELLTDDIIFSGPFGTVRGREELKRFVAMLRQAFADFRMSDELNIAEENRVASLFTMSGLHRGDYHGIPATGNSMSVRGIDIFRFSGDRIAEIVAVIDSLMLMQQLGIVAVQT
ncbi:ester cyclase [bacterium]|nr:ester cyclase [bacterium]MBU1984738.1 ester cyclase [bacterium]